jgi:glycosyltransferase involved in cell wall biosynthesis
MNTDPLITIMMNCYNGEQYLEEAIQSVLSQSYENWEIVFWDNKSTDNSRNIVHSFNDDRIDYFRSEEHTNLGIAKNMALKEVDTEWLAFLDVDDYWEKDKLQQQVEIIKKDDGLTGLIYGRCNFLYENDDNRIEIYKKGLNLPNGYIFDQLIYENFIPFATTIVNTEKFIEIGAFSDKLSHSMDYQMFLNLASKYRVEVTQDVCATVRIHGNNLTKKLRIKAAHEVIEIVSSFYSNPKAVKALNLHKASLSIAYFREKRIKDFLYSINNLSILKILISRILSKIKRIVFK